MYTYMITHTLSTFVVATKQWLSACSPLLGPGIWVAGWQGRDPEAIVLNLCAGQKVEGAPSHPVGLLPLAGLWGTAPHGLPKPLQLRR